MCGICGILCLGGSEGRVDEPALIRMRDTMIHRGPDGEGIWIAPDGRAGLGHRRLAIIDLSPLAAQPMSNEDGTIRITYNGEIYTHRAIRNELERLGYTFRSRSDTEVILHGYRQWGEGIIA